MEAPALQELTKSKNEDEADMYICFRVIFLQPRMKKCVRFTYMSHIYLCLWLDVWWKSLFIHVQSCFVPLRFYVNFSYHRFSLRELRAALCE